MSVQRPSRCALEPSQLALARSKLAQYASLNADERKTFLKDTVREVWLSLNPDYNWTELGEPPNDGTTSYFWTENRVRFLMTQEGTKDITKALDDTPVRKWTGKQVFIAECGDIIMEAIYRDYPEEKKVHRGFFKHLRTYQTSCYDELLPEERIWFEERAMRWTVRGASHAVKAKNAKLHLAKWLKDMTHKGEREYGVYTAFIIVPEPGTGGEPRIVDYLKELRYSEERLSDWVDWTPVTERVKEYVDKSHTAMEAKAKLQAAGQWVPEKSKTKPRGTVPSEIELTVDLERQCVVLPTDLYLEDPDEVLWHEEALLREVVMKAYALASNSKKNVTVPWSTIAKDPAAFFAAECLPPTWIEWKFPGNMTTADRKAALIFWLELGFLKIKQIKQGKKLVPARVATVAPAGSAVAAQGGLGGAVVNRYGSHGKKVLAAAELELYEPEEDKVNAHVMEDAIIDPAELERTEDDVHGHMAPCAVPVTSEARAQYCLTALQLVRECPDRQVAVECVKRLVMLPTSSRDSTSDRKIEKNAKHLVAPESVSWDAASPLIADAEIMAVRQWLSRTPYDYKGFLGWSQAWKYMLGMVMFLVSETSRTVNVHELQESSTWALIMDEIPGDTGAVDVLSGREALSDDFSTFHRTLEMLSHKAWPGLPPSCRYRHASSRSGYITRICQAPGMADLVHLATLLPVAPDDTSSAAPVAPVRTWGSWEWGRCGLSNDFYSDVTVWKGLIDAWTGQDAFKNSDGLRMGREEALTEILKIALAWTDCDKLKNIPYELQPVILQGTVIDPTRARLDITRGIRTQTAFLKAALTGVEIGVRPSAPRPTFIALTPDLRLRLVETISRLRQTKDTLTPTQTRAQRAHVHEARFRTQILKNIQAAKARRAAGAPPEPPLPVRSPEALARDMAGAPATPDAADEPVSTRRAKKSRKSAVPLVPVLTLQTSLPDRDPQVELDELDSPVDMGTPPPPAESSSRRRGSVASKGGSKRPRKSASSARTPAKAKTKSTGSAKTPRASKAGRAGGAGSQSKSKSAPKRKAAKRKVAESETDSSDEEDFTARMAAEEDDDDDEEEEEEEHTPRPPPRPRMIVRKGSAHELALLAKRKRNAQDVDGDEEAAPGRAESPAPMPPQPVAGPSGHNGTGSSAAGSAASALGLSPDDPPSALEVRPVKRARPAVEVSLERMDMM